MKPEIHPDYHKVLFVDSATGTEWSPDDGSAETRSRRRDAPRGATEISNVSHLF
jgi:ribosomal protein L31